MNSYDIAKLAGVSRSTVSRVVNNYSNVPKDTQKRVLEVIKQYNYVPRASARALAGVENKIIGLFMVDKKTDTEGHKASMSSYFSPFMNGVIDTANKNGFHVLVYIVGKASDYKKVREIFYNKTISGGIFIGQQNDHEIDEIIEDGFKTVLIDRLDSNEKPQQNCIIVNANNFDGAYKATKYLIDLGHKRIAHVSGYAGQLSTIDRINGYKKALLENEIVYDGKLMVRGDFMHDSGYTATKKLFTQSSPSAIFYANDSMAMGGIEAIHELGLRIPEDVSIVGFDDIEISSYLQPALTTVRLPIDAMSSSATNTLINAIQNETDYCARYTIPVDFIERQSCCRHNK